MSDDYVLTDQIKAMTPVVDSDHPLSLGYRVILVSDSNLVRPEYRLSRADYLEYVGAARYEGCHNVYNNSRIVTITISGSSASGEPLALLRLVELVVHEVSHLVDAMFERASLVTIDTELRAYYMDWIVGKILHRFEI